jgi:hypothetical protein
LGVGESVSGGSEVVGCSDIGGGEDGEELGEACPVHDERTIRQQIRTKIGTTSRREAFILLLPTLKNSQAQMNLCYYNIFFSSVN